MQFPTGMHFPLVAQLSEQLAGPALHRLQVPEESHGPTRAHASSVGSPGAPTYLQSLGSKATPTKGELVLSKTQLCKTVLHIIVLSPFSCCLLSLLPPYPLLQACWAALLCPTLCRLSPHYSASLPLPF